MLKCREHYLVLELQRAVLKVFLVQVLDEPSGNHVRQVEQHRIVDRVGSLEK